MHSASYGTYQSEQTETVYLTEGVHSRHNVSYMYIAGKGRSISACGYCFQQTRSSDLLLCFKELLVLHVVRLIARHETVWLL